MVENAGERKPTVVDSIKVEAPVKVKASGKVEASVKVEASSINSGVCDNDVNTAHFYSTRDAWKDKGELLGWVRREATMVCERSGEHKVQKRKVKHEATGSRKCGCLFKLRGYA